MAFILKILEPADQSSRLRVLLYVNLKNDQSLKLRSFHKAIFPSSITSFIRPLVLPPSNDCLIRLNIICSSGTAMPQTRTNPCDSQRCCSQEVLHLTKCLRTFDSFSSQKVYITLCCLFFNCYLQSDILGHTEIVLSCELHNISPLAGGLVCRAD